MKSIAYIALFIASTLAAGEDNVNPQAAVAQNNPAPAQAPAPAQEPAPEQKPATEQAPASAQAQSPEAMPNMQESANKENKENWGQGQWINGRWVPSQWNNGQWNNGQWNNGQWGNNQWKNNQWNNNQWGEACTTGQQRCGGPNWSKYYQCVNNQFIERDCSAGTYCNQKTGYCSAMSPTQI